MDRAIAEQLRAVSTPVVVINERGRVLASRGGEWAPGDLVRLPGRPSGRTGLSGQLGDWQATGCPGMPLAVIVPREAASVRPG